MSVVNALAFIRQLRADAELRGRLQVGPSEDGLAALCALAAAEGRRCDPADLREAFWIEWAARAAHYAARASSK
jgi:hypothetical protein